MTRDEILEQNPIATYLERKGIRLRGSTPKLTTNVCPIIKHKQNHLCVEINVDKQLWNCHDCGQGGTVIDWVIHEQGLTPGQAVATFDPQSHAIPAKNSPSRPVVSIQRTRPSTDLAGITALYDYTTETGEMVYQVVRILPKSFRQRRPDGKGGWIWTMEHVTRVLFQLPKVLNSQEVLIVEGEKDCLTLCEHGYVATTNVGGAGKWLDAYSECLRDKDIIIFPDNDIPGRKHADQIIASLRDKANSIKLILVPQIFKDVTDWLNSIAEKEQAKAELATLIKNTPHLLKPPPWESIEELEERYRIFIKTLANRSLDLGRFLPPLGKIVGQPLVPGELVLILGDTGIGKSCLAQAMARSTAPLPTCFFELELPGELLYERWIQMEINCYASDVKTEYEQLTEPIWTSFKGLHHILTCHESGLTIKQIENYIIKSQLRFGQPPVCVFVDYVGLVRGDARSRYENLSNIAEALKVIAKKTSTIVIMASQVARPSHKRESLEIHLHDAKDSGALEYSSGLVIGCWRPERDKMTLKVLKNTRGPSGDQIEVKFDGARMRIYADPIQPSLHVA